MFIYSCVQACAGAIPAFSSPMFIYSCVQACEEAISAVYPLLVYNFLAHAQERFQLAEMYFRKALAINPHSPILMCHIAVVQHALHKSDRALETLHAAIGRCQRCDRNIDGVGEGGGLFLSVLRIRIQLKGKEQMNKTVISGLFVL